MKEKLYSRLYLIIIPFILFSCTYKVKDSDGNRYNTLKIGTHVWMTENLNVRTFRNGDSIAEAKSAEEWIKFGLEGKPAWCTLNNDTANLSKYGRLYNWYAVNDPRGLAPKGWHIPTNEEWTNLINYLGGGVLAAYNMRFTDTDDTDNRWKGFNGLPAGARGLVTFYGISSHGYWWTSTEDSETSAWIRMLNFQYCDVKFLIYNKGTGLSVRCIKD